MSAEKERPVRRRSARLYNSPNWKMVEVVRYLRGLPQGRGNEQVDVSVENGVISITRHVPRAETWEAQIPVGDIEDLRLDARESLGGMFFLPPFGFGWRRRAYSLVIATRRTGLVVEVELEGKSEALERIRETIFVERERLAIGN